MLDKKFKHVIVDTVYVHFPIVHLFELKEKQFQIQLVPVCKICSGESHQ